LKLLPSCKSVHPLQMSYLKLMKWKTFKTSHSFSILHFLRTSLVLYHARWAPTPKKLTTTFFADTVYLKIFSKIADVTLTWQRKANFNCNFYNYKIYHNLLLHTFMLIEQLVTWSWNLQKEKGVIKFPLKRKGCQVVSV